MEGIPPLGGTLSCLDFIAQGLQMNMLGKNKDKILITDGEMHLSFISEVGAEFHFREAEQR